jgi:hypothetical protein
VPEIDIAPQEGDRRFEASKGHLVDAGHCVRRWRMDGSQKAQSQIGGRAILSGHATQDLASAVSF